MNEPSTVIVTDVSMEFVSMVRFILKWLAATAIASLLLALPVYLLFLALFVAASGSHHY
jgi:hypothetical protein